MIDTLKARKQFRDQRSHAKQRSIEFHLTFEEWLDIWEKSGHYEERGKMRGQYVMSRYGDSGPYTVDNVFIQAHSQNIKDAHVGRKYGGKSLSEEHKEKIRASNIGKKHSEEAKAKMREAKIGKKPSDEARNKMREAKLGRKFSEEHKEKIRAGNKGKKLSEETKAKMSAAAKNRCKNRGIKAP
jgi:NUMOD3 motif